MHIQLHHLPSLTKTITLILPLSAQVVPYLPLSDRNSRLECLEIIGYKLDINHSCMYLQPMSLLAQQSDSVFAESYSSFTLSELLWNPPLDLLWGILCMSFTCSLVAYVVHQDQTSTLSYPFTQFFSTQVLRLCRC